MLNIEIMKRIKDFLKKVYIYYKENTNKTYDAWF